MFQGCFLCRVAARGQVGGVWNRSLILTVFEPERIIICKSIPYRAKLDGARLPEGHALWDARKGIPFRATLSIDQYC